MSTPNLQKLSCSFCSRKDIIALLKPENICYFCLLKKPNICCSTCHENIVLKNQRVYDRLPKSSTLPDQCDACCYQTCARCLYHSEKPLCADGLCTNCMQTNKMKYLKLSKKEKKAFHRNACKKL